MNLSIEQILSYNVITISFNPIKNQYDNYVLKMISNHAKKMADNVNNKAANNSDQPREKSALITDNFIGTLSEYSWKIAINALLVDTIVKESDSVNLENQIDLETLKDKYSIEVRSSFVRNGIKFALGNSNHPFDILGPYINDYKLEESSKDFYLRCLYHFDNRKKSEFINKVNNEGIVVYLIGGASLEMMQDESLYIIKNMKAGSEIGINVEGSLTQFKAIPIPKAKDALTIIKEIYIKTKSKEIKNDDSCLR